MVEKNPELTEALLEKLVERVFVKLQSIGPFQKRHMDESEYLSTMEVCKMFCPPISRTTLHNWVKEGRLKKYYIGGKVVFRKDELQQALKVYRKYQRSSEVVLIAA